MDTLTPEQRARTMSRIKGRNTGPELLVRRLLHRLGYRFRLHVKDLPGTPDIVLPRHRVIIFVHGCFWHGHHNCPRATIPETRREFWLHKITSAQARDVAAQAALTAAGWRVLTLWQCELKHPALLESRLLQFLSNASGGQGAALHPAGD